MARRKRSQLEMLFGSAPAQIASRHHFMLDGNRVEYTLKRSRRRRTITLTIDEDGLRVGAPWRASLQRVDALLDSHARWIARKLAEWRARRPPPFTWQAGATVMAMGEPLTLVIGSAAVYSDLIDPGSRFPRVTSCEPDARLLATARRVLPEAHLLPIATAGRIGAGAFEVEAMEGFGVLRAAELAGVPAIELRAVANLVAEPDRSRWLVDEALSLLAEATARLLAELRGAS